MKKLLLFGSDCIHTYNYYQLIKDYFDEILLVCDKYGEHCKSLNPQIINGSFKPFYKIFGKIKKTKKIIKQFKPDIIHIQQIGTLSFIALKANKKSFPTVVTAWGSDILVNPKKNFLLKKLAQYSLNNGNYFTSDSEFMAEAMRKLAKKPIDVTIANFGIEEIKSLPKKNNIIYSNRLHKKLYRIDYIIQAFSIFLKKNPNWKLIVAATGEETNTLKKLSNSLDLNNNIEFVGWVNKKQNADYYAMSKYWISIPASDATSISLLEAISANCIPIVSDLPANREWIQHKKNGFIVSDVNSDFISEAINYKMENIFEINQKLISEKATKAVNREKFFNIYNKILNT